MLPWLFSSDAHYLDKTRDPVQRMHGMCLVLSAVWLACWSAAGVRLSFRQTNVETCLDCYAWHSRKGCAVYLLHMYLLTH